MKYIVFVTLLACVWTSPNELLDFIRNGQTKIAELENTIQSQLRFLNENKAGKVLHKQARELYTSIKNYVYSVSEKSKTKSTRFHDLWLDLNRNLSTVMYTMFFSISNTKVSADKLHTQFIDAAQTLANTSQSIANFLEQGIGVHRAKRDIRGYSVVALNISVQQMENLNRALRRALGGASTSRG